MSMKARSTVTCRCILEGVLVCPPPVWLVCPPHVFLAIAAVQTDISFCFESPSQPCRQTVHVGQDTFIAKHIRHNAFSVRTDIMHRCVHIPVPLSWQFFAMHQFPLYSKRCTPLPWPPRHNRQKPPPQPSTGFGSLPSARPFPPPRPAPQGSGCLVCQTRLPCRWCVCSLM